MIKYKCPEQNLTAYIFAELSTTELRAIEKHLAVCGKCQGEVAEIREVVANYPLNDLLPSSALITRTARLVAEVLPSSPAKSSRWFNWAAWQLAPAVAILLLFLISFTQFYPTVLQEEVLIAGLDNLEQEVQALVSAIDSPLVEIAMEDSDFDMDELDINLNGLEIDLKNL